MSKKLPPIHPGEVLREEFLRPMNLLPYVVARAVGVPRTWIERLVNEQTAVTADTGGSPDTSSALSIYGKNGLAKYPLRFVAVP